MTTNTTEYDALTLLMTRIVNFSCDFPTLWAVPEFRALYEDLFDLAAQAMEEAEMARVDRPFAEGFLLLELEELLHHTSEN